MLFELMTPASSALLKRKIKEQIVQYEPRCAIDNIIVNALTDQNTMTVQLDFHVVGNPNAQTVTVDLERTR